MMKIETALRLADRFILKEDYPLYQHSFNVAMICRATALKMELDSELAFNGGLLHDIGKIVWVKKFPEFNFNDHPVLGYAFLKDIDDDAATMAYMHHRYQKNAYPAVVEITVKKDLEPYVRMVAYVDKVEAFITRSHYEPKDAIITVNAFDNFEPEMTEAVYDILNTYAQLRLT
jgi:putative nucleotidyltransferase with HDIG domain